MSLILKNGTYISHDTLTFTQKDVVVKEDTDVITLENDYKPMPGDTIVDCTNKYIMHSFADAYMRPCLSLAASSKLITKKESSYSRYVSDILWNIDKCIDKELLYASALYAALQAVRRGCTFAICRNESHKFIEGSLSVIKAAFDKIGVSTLQCYAASEAEGYAIAEREVAENASFLESNQGLMGISASYLASNELLDVVSKICKERNVGILVNAAEDNIDQTNTMRDWRRTVILRFYELGFMDYPSTILANANAINDNERCYIKNKPSWIVQNPYANFQRGIQPFNSIWLDDNIIMLGTDFASVSVPDTMRHAYFQTVKSDNEIELIDAYKRLDAIHRYVKINKFKGDGDNNLIVFDNSSPFEITQDNFVKHFIYNRDIMDIKLVISNGKIVAKNGHSTVSDEKQILKFIAEQAKRIDC